MIIKLLNDKAQASMEGLQNIINIKASMNKGLSKNLSIAFPNTNPIERPLVKIERINHFN